MQLYIKETDIEEFHKYMLVLISARDEPIKGMIKLQKIMYVLYNIFDEIKDNCTFDLHYYGPYSEIIELELEYLEQIRLVTNDNNRIQLTDEGIKYTNNIIKTMDKKTLSILNEYKRLFNDMTKKELLTYIYLAYPESTNNSDMYEIIKPDMEKYIISLIKKDKITPSRTAELLGDDSILKDY